MAGHSKWANIQHRKGAQDKKRAKLFTKLGRELTIAAREGGSDPNFNPRLRLAIEKAKSGNMPKDIMERAIKKGSGELEGVDFLELRYEGYGPSGTAFIVDAVSDNKNRTASEVRTVFTRKGGNLGTDGAVSWMFKKQGIITIKNENIDFEKLMSDAIDSGAEDIIENDTVYEIITDYSELNNVLENIKNLNYAVEDAEISMIPENKIIISDVETAKKVILLHESLEDLDDVQEVYSNFDIDETILSQI